MGNQTLVRVELVGKRFHLSTISMHVEATSAKNEMITLRKEYENQVCVVKNFG
jgi:hypothetical protein